jgi:hypothetical protein
MRGDRLDGVSPHLPSVKQDAVQPYVHWWGETPSSLLQVINPGLDLFLEG